MNPALLKKRNILFIIMMTKCNQKKNSLVKTYFPGRMRGGPEMMVGYNRNLKIIPVNLNYITLLDLKQLISQYLGLRSIGSTIFWLPGSRSSDQDINQTKTVLSTHKFQTNKIIKIKTSKSLNNPSSLKQINLARKKKI